MTIILYHLINESFTQTIKHDTAVLPYKRKEAVPNNKLSDHRLALPGFHPTKGVHPKHKNCV